MDLFPLPSAFPELEDYILALRPAGVTLKEVSSTLANEGHLNANGEPYNTSTLSKAEKRAQAKKE